MKMPDSLVEECALVGPEGRIRERLQAWKAAGEKQHAASLLAAAASSQAIRVMAEELL